MPHLQQTQKLGLHLSPQQILQSSILQLNSLMIEARIMEELEQNPALELNEEDPIADANDESDDQAEDDIDWDELLNSPDDFNVSRYEDYSRDEMTVQIEAVVSFIEGMVRQLDDLGLSEIEQQISQELLGNVGNDGYLTIDPLLIADRMQVEEEIVEGVRHQIMRLNPPGIGARDLRECLMVQLEIQNSAELPRKIITDHFDNFANRRFGRIMDSLVCSEEELQQAIETIARLNPKPGIGGTSTIGQYIVPDIILDEVDGEWVITLNDGSLPELRISPAYLDMIGRKQKIDAEAKQFVRKKVESAKWFIQAVMQRRQTIIRVITAILARQADYFRDEGSPLKPMVLRDIAEDVQMDISTISRVTSGKYVQTPLKIYELKYFFSEGVTNEDGEEVSTRKIKEELQKIIDSEDKRKPINDEALGLKLKALGYPIARRTVAKYREQLNVPVARLRREL